VVLYVCETSSLTLKEEHRPRAFQNRVLREICGPKRDEVTGGWRKLHNEEFHYLYSSSSIIRLEDEMGSVCSTNWGEEGAYRILVGKPEGKRLLGRRRRRWVDDIKMDVREIGWGGMDWIDLAQYRDRWWALVNTIMNLRVP
jgi:hypothetical protein